MDGRRDNSGGVEITKKSIRSPTEVKGEELMSVLLSRKVQ